MTFQELQKKLEQKLGTTKLADIAREFSVTPQVVSNWKARDQVPYRYVKVLRKKIKKLEQPVIGSNQGPIIVQHSASEFGDEEISIADTINAGYSIIKKNLILVLGLPTIIVAITIFHQLYVAIPVYTSIAKIIPSSGSNAPTNVGGLASQFGININSGKSDILSSELYPEIIKSRTLSRSVLTRKFKTDKFGDERQLIEILMSKNIDRSLDWDRTMKIGIRSLSDNINVIKNKQSNLLTLSVDAIEPQLAADIATAVIEELNSMQNNFKVSRIKEKRLFIESRLKEVKNELVSAEEKLKIFREQNRSFQSSPALMLEAERLLREVQMQMQVFTTLKSQFELAQIEEVEKTDMVDVLDPPEAPVIRTSPRRTRNVMLAGILGISLGLIAGFVKDWLKKNISIFD